MKYLAITGSVPATDYGMGRSSWTRASVCNLAEKLQIGEVRKRRRQSGTIRKVIGSLPRSMWLEGRDESPADARNAHTSCRPPLRLELGGWLFNPRERLKMKVVQQTLLPRTECRRPRYSGMEKIMRQKSVDRRVFEGWNAIIVMVW